MAHLVWFKLRMNLKSNALIHKQQPPPFWSCVCCKANRRIPLMRAEDLLDAHRCFRFLLIGKARRRAKRSGVEVDAVHPAILAVTQERPILRNRRTFWPKATRFGRFLTRKGRFWAISSNRLLRSHWCIAPPRSCACGRPPAPRLG